MVKAEMILEVARLQENARKAEESIRKVGETGAQSARRLNSAFGARDLLGRVNAMRPAAGGGVPGVDSDGFRRAGGMVSALVGGPLSTLTRTLGLVLAASGAAGAGLATMTAVDSVKQAAGFSRSALEIGRFAGGAEKAREILREIDTLAISTPFETSSITEVAKGLLSAGVAGERVMDTVRKLAAVAGDDETLTRLGGALGVGFANQKFELERVKQFLESQINLVPSLASVLGTDNAGVFAAISQGKVGFDEMTAALGKMSEKGGQFFGMMEARSKDLPGQWSTLMGNVEMLQRTMGQWSLSPLTKALDLLNNERLPAAERAAGAVGAKLYEASLLFLGMVAGTAKVNWDPVFDNFLASAMAATHLWGTSLVKEVDRAFHQLTGTKPWMPGEEAGSWAAGRLNPDETNQQRDARKARDAMLAKVGESARRDLGAGGEFGGQGRLWQQSNPRQGGESRAEWFGRLRQAQEDNGWYSSATRALRSQLEAAESAYAALLSDGGKVDEQGTLSRILTAHGRLGSGKGADAVIGELRAGFVQGLREIQIAGRQALAGYSLPSGGSGGGAVLDERVALNGKGGGGSLKRAEVPRLEGLAMPGTARAAEVAGTYAVIGSLAADMRRASGEDTYQLVYQETARQTGILEKIHKVMDAVNRKMDVPVVVKTQTPGVFVP